MYLFLGKPNMLVSTKNKQLINNKVDHVPLFRFDEKGEYRTDDEKMIKRLKGRFDHMEIKEDVEEVKEGSVNIQVEVEPVGVETGLEAKEKDISNMNYNDLRKLAKDKGIELKNPTKAELLERLEGL